MVILGRLDNHVILITGAGSGLGQATAVEAAKEGAKLSLVDLSTEGLQDTEKKVGEPEEVGNLVTFLLSNEATFINAAVIPIDGGQSYKY